MSMPIIKDSCMSCGECAELCPTGAIMPTALYAYSQYYINPDICIACGKCLEVDCPGDAICL